MLAQSGGTRSCAAVSPTIMSMCTICIGLLNSRRALFSGHVASVVSSWLVIDYLQMVVFKSPVVVKPRYMQDLRQCRNDHVTDGRPPLVI